MLEKYPLAPRPFVLTPPLNHDRHLPAGRELILPLTLIGHGLNYLPHFIVGFEALGRHGDFGGPFRLTRVTSLAGATVYDACTRRVSPSLPLYQAPAEPSPVSRLRLQFVTPLRLRADGHYTRRPGFPLLVQALLRRLHLLGCVHGSWPDDLTWRKPLLELADRASVESSTWEMSRWSRTSGRQQRAIDMDGVLGSIEVSGELGELMPALRLGEHLHIGSGTTMGLGRYRLEVC
jgi:CRISPR/Cas system endoribonuclease Cas6 (RAMP superfamily)